MAEMSWCKASASQFQVRCGPNYPRNKFKAPSAEALGEVVAMDAFYTKCKLHNIMQHGYIELPKATPGWSEPYAEFLVVNQMLPLHFKNALFTNEHTDGETVNLVTYVRFPAGLAKGWRDDEEPRTAEQLLKRFLLRADQDSNIAHCLKELGLVLNTEEIKTSLPRSVYSLLVRFNGKPILTRPEHQFFRHPENRYFGIDLNGHQYTLTTRTGVAKAIGHLQHLVLGYGMVIEARKEHELPETLLFCSNLLRLSAAKGTPFPPTGDDPPAG